METGRIQDRVRGHENVVSCLVTTHSPRLIVSGSWDCSVRLWRVRLPLLSLSPAQHLLAELDHDDQITALAINR